MDYLVKLAETPGTILAALPPLLIKIIVMAAFAVALLTAVAVLVLFFIYLERKTAGHMQDRLGPMEVGWHGTLQTVADGVKLLLKEDIIPALADRRLFVLAPYLVFLGSFAVFAAIPFSENIIASNLNIGILYIIAVSSLVVIGIIMAGWASNNKYALYGAMRAAAQIVSYEIPIALSIITVVMAVGSLGMQDIVNAQAGGLANWLIFKHAPFNFIAFFILFIGGTAEVNRSPFDLAEAESELVAGFHVEYSGMRFAIFFLAEYASMFAVGAIVATLFLGGWHSPFGAPDAAWVSIIWLSAKSIFLVFVMMWFRWTFPRLRVDQLMYTCWKVLIPISFVNIIGAGIWMELSG